MKASELIKALKTLIAESGDTEILISVHDGFGRYGYDATIDIEASGTIWTGISTLRETQQTRLSAYLVRKNYGVDANPKITFRKPS